MSKYRKLFFVAAFVLALSNLSGTAFAAAATLSMSATGSGDSVQVTATGDPNSSVILSYNKVNVGPSLFYMGNTDSNGSFSLTISTSTYGANPGDAVSVKINNVQSPSVTWPGTAAGTGTFTLSQSGVTTSVGQTVNITANNTSGSVYLSNNSNPPIANVNISGSQISIIGLTNGSTVATICSGNSSTCSSVYITVGSTSTQTLTFSINTVTVSPGQSIPITISGGTGTYTVLNNSNSSVIQAGINGSTVTVTTNNTSGSAAITICSTNMSSCGIINATAGSSSVTPISFSQTSPTLSVGQSLPVTITGGAPSSGANVTYFVSTNSNSIYVQAAISGNSLNLTGNANGTSTITVCSSAGTCGSLTATVSFTSSGGSLQLSQSSIALLVGQVLSVTISGGQTPYTISGGTSSVAQTSLNGNIINVSGLTAGSSNMTVCSAGGACIPLSIIINASGTGTQLSFSQSSVTVAPGGSSSITLSGSGGYYSSNSTNPAVATVQVNGNTAVVTGLTTGSNNISICQSGGQCAILFVTVTGNSTGTSLPIFSQTNPTVAVGQTFTITVSGGASTSYYVLTNTTPAVLQATMNNNQLALTGLTAGTSTVVICTSATNCSSLSVTVGTATLPPITFTGMALPYATVGTSYSTMMSSSGGSGSYTYAITSGALPAGLVLTTTGLISGTPTTVGSNSFTAKVTDSSGNTASAVMSLAVSGSLTTPTPTPTPSTPSTSIYANGQLINEKGVIYIVYQNTKVAFTNAPAFLGLGFSFKNVLVVTDSGLTVSPRTVITATGSHPRGTWVSSGKSIFFVSPAGLIPVTDWQTFISNGGDAAFIVKANKYDLAMKKLTNLTANDSRLHP